MRFWVKFKIFHHPMSTFLYLYFKFSFRLMLGAKVKSLLFARQPTSPAPRTQGPSPNRPRRHLAEGKQNKCKNMLRPLPVCPNCFAKDDDLSRRNEAIAFSAAHCSPSSCHPPLRPSPAPQFVSLPRGQWQLSLQFCNQLRLKVKFSQAQWGKRVPPGQNATPCIIVQVSLNKMPNTNLIV